MAAFPLPNVTPNIAWAKLHIHTDKNTRVLLEARAKMDPVEQAKTDIGLLWKLEPGQDTADDTPDLPFQYVVPKCAAYGVLTDNRDRALQKSLSMLAAAYYNAAVPLCKDHREKMVTAMLLQDLSQRVHDASYPLLAEVLQIELLIRLSLEESYYKNNATSSNRWNLQCNIGKLIAAIHEEHKRLAASLPHRKGVVYSALKTHREVLKLHATDHHRELAWLRANQLYTTTSATDHDNGVRLGNIDALCTLAKREATPIAKDVRLELSVGAGPAASTPLTECDGVRDGSLVASTTPPRTIAEQCAGVPGIYDRLASIIPPTLIAHINKSDSG
jgi:hypothetical protein